MFTFTFALAICLAFGFLIGGTYGLCEEMVKDNEDNKDNE